MTKLLSTVCLSMIFAFILSEATANPQYPNIGIVNGSTAGDGEFPYMVQLLSDYDYFSCGGSIIGDTWILTAGHCVEDEFTKKIVYGTNVLIEGKKVNTTIRIKKRYLHPQFYYNETALGSIPLFDVGIFELEHAIPLNAKAQPVTLANASAQVPFHKIGTLAGWGANDSNAPSMEYLQKIDLLLLNDTECRQKIFDYSGEDVFNSTHNLCTNDFWNGECSGDSGSAFVIDGVQYGLSSWTYRPCGIAPGSYTRLTTPAYREFIRNVTGI